MAPSRRRWLPRMARRLGLDRNELRRRSDRVESAITLVLLLGFLIGVPAAGIHTGQSAHRAQQRAERASARHLVTAELTASAERAREPEGAETGARHLDRPLVPARWHYAGVWHSGRIPAAPGSREGTKIPVWVDGQGRLSGPPAHDDGDGRPAYLVAGLSMFGLSAALWLARRGVRWVFIQRQLAAWEAEWAAVAPEWTRRR